MPFVFSRAGKSGRVTRDKEGIMVNDYLSDLVTRIRNGYMADLPVIQVPYTRVGYDVVRVLVAEGYLAKAEKKEKIVELTMKYKGKNPAIMGIKRMSKPGARIYTNLRDMPKVWGGLGMNILSTPKGIISSKQARKLNTGGEIVAQIW